MENLSEYILCAAALGFWLAPVVLVLLCGATRCLEQLAHLLTAGQPLEHNR